MALRFCSLLLTMALLLPAQAPANQDAIIHDQVLLALSTDRDVRGTGIQVEVKSGVVTLRGRVSDKKAKDRAEKLAKKIKGVKSVENQLLLPDVK